MARRHAHAHTRVPVPPTSGWPPERGEGRAKTGKGGTTLRVKTEITSYPCMLGCGKSRHWGGGYEVNRPRGPKHTASALTGWPGAVIPAEGVAEREGKSDAEVGSEQARPSSLLGWE